MATSTTSSSTRPGSPAPWKAPSPLPRGGTLVLVGVLKADITFSDSEFHRREMTVKATRNATRQDFETVMAAMERGDVPMDALNTHAGTLDELPEAMPAWLRSKTPPLKAIVTV